MYRRIELLGNMISGLCWRMAPDEVIDAWVRMPGPKKRVAKGKFYFTEKGWERYGRATVKACIKTGTPYRVIAQEEHSCSVYYKDEIQVVLYPRRKGRK